MEHLSLLAGAQPVSVTDWEREAAAVLRKAGRLTDAEADAAVWASLMRTTLDGVAITPLGLPGGTASTVRPARIGSWDIRSLIGSSDAKAANVAALADLEGGATSLWVAGGDLPARLDGVLLDLAPVILDDPANAAELIEYADDRGVRLHPHTNLGADPLGRHIRHHDNEGDFADLLSTARLARDHGVLGVVVDATAVHDRGATDVQELGYSIALGAAYLRTLVADGLSVADAADLIEFRYAATDEQFVTIAKLRAARLLWNSVLTHSDVERLVEQRQHAVTSRPMLSRYDPYVNLLRGTVAGFAAGVGGADAVTVLPFDAPNGQPDELGRRIARNTSHLLIDEAHVAAAADPAGGSYFVEKLTADLAEAAWREFRRIDAEGFDGLSERVADAASRRDALVASRKKPITGLTEFPSLEETLPVREPDPANDGVRFHGAAFEELRDTPPAGRAFLATLGPVAHHTARATFASNLLAAGGVAIDSAGATTGPESLVASYAGQSVAMLAGTDDAYAEWGAEAAAALRAAGASYIVIAGKPADYADDSAALGVDALAFLTRVRQELLK